MNTLADIAAEFGIDTTTARIRCEGMTLDHVGNTSPLDDADASMIRASVSSICTCTDPSVTCPACLARRDVHGFPTNWRERMRVSA